MGKDDLKQERMRILDLLSKGIITPDDAEKLLSAMVGSGNDEPTIIIPQKKASFRMLKILIDSSEGDNVKIELPIEFAKLLKTSKFNVEKLGDMDIDIDALIQMINNGAVGDLVNITSADGDIVRIVVE